MLPATEISAGVTILGMGNPGKRPGTPSEARDAIIARIKAARMKHGWTYEEIAELLTQRVGRTIPWDTYRGWERTSLMPHDVIIPFCYLTGTDAYELLTGEPFRLGQVIHFPTERRKKG